MTRVIEAIRLRPLLSNAFPSPNAQGLDSLYLRGVPRTLQDSRSYDGFIKKASGLDSAQVNILSNSVYSGGTSATGTRYNDREVILTLGSSDVRGLRSDIQKLMGMASRKPLELAIDLYSELENSVYTVTAECFIKNLAAPIFDSETSIELTLNCPKPYFEGVRRSTVGTPKIEPEAKEGAFRCVRNGNVRYFYFTPALDDLSQNMSYKTPVSVSFSFPWKNAMGIKRFKMIDIHGNALEATVKDPAFYKQQVQAGGRNVTFKVNSLDKTFESTHKSHFDFRVTGGWPESLPLAESLAIEVEIEDSSYDYTPEAFTGFNYTPRMVGV